MLCREGQGKASSCCVAPPEHPLQLLLAVWDRTARAQCSPSTRANTSPDPRRTPPRAVCQLGFGPHSMGWSQPGGPCPPFQHRDWDLPFQQGRWHPARTATSGHTALRILPLSLNSPRSSAAHACWRASPPRAFQAILWGWQRRDSSTGCECPHRHAVQTPGVPAWHGPISKAMAPRPSWLGVG